VNDLKDAMYMTSNYVTYKTFDNSQYDKIDRIVDIIFDIIIVITMFLSFFSLSASMGANIFEMSKEIGVLRSLGFTKTRIKILFMYESFILVLASSFLGILIGLFVGVSMMIQEDIFNNMPINFYFPLPQFILIFAITLVCAVVSTYTPAKQIMD
jgi:putative ABC transport system permease protein